MLRVPQPDHRDEQDQQQAERAAATLPVAVVRPMRADQRVRHEAAEHEQVAVGEVDQLDDAVDERVADGDQRPDGAVGEAVLQVGGEPRQVAVVLQVLDPVDDGQDQQERDQAEPGDVLADDLAARARAVVREWMPIPWGCPFGAGGGPDEPARRRRAGSDGLGGCALITLSNTSLPTFGGVSAVVAQRGVAVRVDVVRPQRALAALRGEERLDHRGACRRRPRRSRRRRRPSPRSRTRRTGRSRPAARRTRPRSPCRTAGRPAAARPATASAPSGTSAPGPSSGISLVKSTVATPSGPNSLASGIAALRSL